MARVNVVWPLPSDDYDVYYYIAERSKFEGETEKMGVGAKPSQRERWFVLKDREARERWFVLKCRNAIQTLFFT